MRIIAGEWRRRLLQAPAGDDTRPTGDRVRETLFSMLASRLGGFDELTVLDLFAGSGALALEALSRGSTRAWLVERAPDARAAIEANIATFKANARLIGHDATALPRAEAPADLLFLDPPYRSGLAAAALQSAQAGGWIAPHSWISVETARDEMPEVPGFRIVADRQVGKAKLHLLRMDG